MPVPLHRSRLRARGFNQAALLARAVVAADRRVGAFAPRVLGKRVATARQALLGRSGRAANLQGAFQVRDPASVRDAEVLLVDDILTTGMTARACARALLEANACRVDVLALARTPRPSFELRRSEEADR